MPDTTVTDIMTEPVLTVEPSTPLSEIADAMLEQGIKSIAVVDEDCKPTGILTSTDFIAAVSAGVDSAATVAEYMATDVVTVEPDVTVSGAAAEMFGNDISHLPVVEDDDIVGIVTATDITEYVATYIYEE